MLAYQMCFKPGEAPNGNEYVQFMVMLERNYLSFVMTSFTPTILANIISYSTNFFPRDNFDAAIGVNLTLLLVITTMYWLTLHSSLSHPFPRSLTRWLTLYNVKLLWGSIKQFLSSSPAQNFDLSCFALSVILICMSVTNKNCFTWRLQLVTCMWHSSHK